MRRHPLEGALGDDKRGGRERKDHARRGLGRTIDGSYAEYTVVDAANVIPFDTDLGWDVIGGLPEMLQTAHGALARGLRLQAGQSVLIHGATSTVGLTAVAIAHQLGAIVLATTRNPVLPIYETNNVGTKTK